MIKILMAAAAAAALAGAGQPAAQPGQAEAQSSFGPATVTELMRSGQTASGQPLGAIAAPYEVVVSRSEIPAGGTLPIHKHPWPRYGYVLSGRLRVTYEESGNAREFGPGEVLIEAVDQWHAGQAVGAEPVRIIIIDHVQPGQTNIVRR